MTLNDILNVIGSNIKVEVYKFMDYQGYVIKDSEGNLKKKFDLDNFNNFIDLEVTDIKIKVDDETLIGNLEVNLVE